MNRIRTYSGLSNVKRLYTGSPLNRDSSCWKLANEKSLSTFSRSPSRWCRSSFRNLSRTTSLSAVFGILAIDVSEYEGDGDPQGRRQTLNIPETYVALAAFHGADVCAMQSGSRGQFLL